MARPGPQGWPPDRLGQWSESGGTASGHSSREASENKVYFPPRQARVAQEHGCCGLTRHCPLPGPPSTEGPEGSGCVQPGHPAPGSSSAEPVGDGEGGSRGHAPGAQTRRLSPVLKLRGTRTDGRDGGPRDRTEWRTAPEDRGPSQLHLLPRGPQEDGQSWRHVCKDAHSRCPAGRGRGLAGVRESRSRGQRAASPGTALPTEADTAKGPRRQQKGAEP